MKEYVIDQTMMLNLICQNTEHKMESIAEILDLEVDELLNTAESNVLGRNRLKQLADFLSEYNIL